MKKISVRWCPRISHLKLWVTVVFVRSLLLQVHLCCQAVVTVEHEKLICATQSIIDRHHHHHRLSWKGWWQFLTHSQVQCWLLSCRRQCRLAHLSAPPVSLNLSITLSIGTRGTHSKIQGVIVYVFLWIPCVCVCVCVYINSQASTEPLGSWLAQCVWDGCILLITMLLYFGSH